MRVMIVGAATTPARVEALARDGVIGWGLNAIVRPFGGPAGVAQRCARWFQIHPPDTCDPGERRWAEQCPVPLDAIRHYPEWPMSRPYPLAAVRALPGADAAGFASSFAYAVAAAILAGATEVYLLGTLLHRGTLREALVERANLAWWVGYAQGRGLAVTCDPGHPAAPPGQHLYGYEYLTERAAVAGYCQEYAETARAIDGP
jgi:hypothetical protein